MKPTKVVFRKYPNGEIIALFPEAVNRNYSVSSYMIIGQHGDADYTGVIASTKAATKEEYAKTKKILEDIGYKNIRVQQKAKIHYKF